jgi:hypothetical protein
VVEYLCAFFDHEGDGPCKEVHEVGEEVGMRAVDELLDIETVILKSSHSYFKFDDCAFVVVKVTIIGGRKDGDN